MAMFRAQWTVTILAALAACSTCRTRPNPPVPAQRSQIQPARTASESDNRAHELLCAGDAHSCAVGKGGEVYCWGMGTSGQLGDGRGENSGVPRRVRGIADAVEIACGPHSTCALSRSGRAFCWGEAAFGPGRDALSPVPVLGVTDATQLAVSGSMSCAMLASRELTCWNRRSSVEPGQPWHAELVPHLADLAEIRASRRHFCVRSGSGKVLCWSDELPRPPLDLWTMGALEGAASIELDGSKACGQIGRERHCLDLDTRAPAAVTELQLPLGAPRLSRVARGGQHDCATTPDDVVLCWGDNTFGQLGIGRFGATKTAQVVGSLRQGFREHADKPEPPAEPSRVENIVMRPSMGPNHLCAVTSHGTVRCAGFSNFGELGDGPRDPASTEWPPATRLVTMLGVTDAVEVAAGRATTCVRRANGAVACSGSLALHTPESPGPSRTLRAVRGVAGAVAVAVGSTSACVVLQSGKVMCWGGNGHGELGSGTLNSGAATLSDSYAKVQEIAGLDDAVEIACGNEFSCARLRSGDVKCWGRADHGGLGDGSLEPRPIPKLVPNIRDASALSAGGSSVCAIHAAGAVSCWGAVSGYLPMDPETATSLRPVGHDGRPRRVRGLPPAVAIGVGERTGCAITRGGDAHCFEAGSSPRAPMHVFGVTKPADVPYLAMTCGQNACCGIQSSGMVSCWGELGAIAPKFAGPRNVATPVVLPEFELRGAK